MMNFVRTLVEEIKVCVIKITIGYRKYRKRARLTVRHWEKSAHE